MMPIYKREQHTCIQATYCIACSISIFTHSVSYCMCSLRKQRKRVPRSLKLSLSYRVVRIKMLTDVCLNLSFKDISTSPLKTINTIFIQDAHLDYHNGSNNNGKVIIIQKICLNMKKM